MDFELFVDAATIIKIVPEVELKRLYDDLLSLSEERDRVPTLLTRYLNRGSREENTAVDVETVTENDILNHEVSVKVEEQMETTPVLEQRNLKRVKRKRALCYLSKRRRAHDKETAYNMQRLQQRDQERIPLEYMLNFADTAGMETAAEPRPRANETVTSETGGGGGWRERRAPPAALGRPATPDAAVDEDDEVQFIGVQRGDLPQIYCRPLQVVQVDPGDIGQLCVSTGCPSPLRMPFDVQVAAGFAAPTAQATQPRPEGTEHAFLGRLMTMFPDACPKFLRDKCIGWPNTNIHFNEVVNLVLSEGYRQRERAPSPDQPLDFDDQYKMLLELFPDADPNYLQHQCERLIDSPEDLQEFVNNSLERRDYPSKADYLKKLKLTAQQKQYTTDFDVKEYLKVIPEPDKYFSSEGRVGALQLSSAHADDRMYARIFLNNHFRHVHMREIQTALVNNEYDVIKAAVSLERVRKTLRHKRRLYPLTMCSNIPLLQELAFIEHKAEILDYLGKQRRKLERKRDRAKARGELYSCVVCLDEELLASEMSRCTKGHEFCRPCVRQGCDVALGMGRVRFACLAECDGEFTLHELQSVLSPQVFSKVARKKQVEEVKAAGIDDLESCPFCDFATIPAVGDKVFRCMNEECMKESCRQCHAPSHIPLRCDEVEREEEVRQRTYIEDRMTEALVRVCYRCNMKFVKEDGCNKMTCQCGASMCYVCGEPVHDYRHFNGQGGDQHHLCPLYSDTTHLHMTEVSRAAEQARQELGLRPDHHIKHDPTRDLDEHYEEQRMRYTGGNQLLFPAFHLLLEAIEPTIRPRFHRVRGQHHLVPRR